MDDHIEFKRIRPRIYVETSLSAEEINLRIRNELQDQKRLCDGQSTKGFATICPPKEEQHFWSPQLTITLEETSEGSEVRGLYGPKPSVWTMFVFFYATIGFSILILSIIGLSYWSLGKSAGFLWILPVLIGIFFTLYAVAYFGQKLGQKQMTKLHRFLERCLGKDIEPI